MKKIEILLLFLFVVSCNQNKIIEKNILLKSPNGVIDFKNNFFTHYNLFENDTKTKFYLTDKDWNYLQKSFKENKIYELKGKKLGFYTNSIDFKYDAKIETNNGTLNLKIDGILADKNQKGFLNEESKNYDKFVTEAYSIAYWRSENSKFTKKQVDSMVEKYYSENY